MNDCVNSNTFRGLVYTFLSDSHLAQRFAVCLLCGKQATFVIANALCFCENWYYSRAGQREW